jgi:hypothetical protein
LLSPLMEFVPVIYINKDCTVPKIVVLLWAARFRAVHSTCLPNKKKGLGWWSISLWWQLRWAVGLGPWEFFVRKIQLVTNVCFNIFLYHPQMFVTIFCCICSCSQMFLCFKNLLSIIMLPYVPIFCKSSFIVLCTGAIGLVQCNVILAMKTE